MSSLLSRRRFLSRLGALGVLAASPGVWAQPQFKSSPFTLGVASGYPLADGVALWTRLAPDLFAPDGGMPPQYVPVAWEVASDEAFKHVAAKGTAYAEPAYGHAVHVEVTGLDAGREYWYRFHSGKATSPARAKPT